MNEGFSELEGITISLLLSITYVVLIYVNKPQHAALKNGIIDRNDPIVAHDRVRKVTQFSVLTVAILPIILAKLASVPLLKVFYQYGLIPGFKYSQGLVYFDVKEFEISIWDILKNALLVMLLFNGPLIDYLFFNDDDGLSLFDDLKDQLSTIQGQRDLIIGPLTEEIIYTASIIITLHQVPGISNASLVFLPPAFFSIAHFHHAYELYTNGTFPLKMILISCLFQLFYTFLFGIFTNYLFLRTRNLWSCFVVHFFCNFMGFPKLNGFDNNIWRLVYYCLLIFGIWLFKNLLGPLTESPLELVHL